MTDYFQKLIKYTQDGLREFSEHPIKYTGKALGDLVKDYWDFGITAFGGYLVSQSVIQNDMFFSDYNESIGSSMFIVGSLAPVKVGPKNERRNRFLRNTTAGASGLLLGSGYLYVFGSVTTILSLYQDILRKRIRAKTSSSENSQLKIQDNSLENLTKQI